jgi:hypothetical protein
VGEGPTTDVLATALRRVEVRVSQLEDKIGFYGPPPAKRKRLPIPEITPAQREFLIWLAVFATLSVVGAARKSHGE